MGKSLVMPRAASLSTIRGEIPSFATSRPSSPAPASVTVPGHDAGVVALNPRGLGEAWNARRIGGGGTAARHGESGELAGGGERRATPRNVLRGCAADREAVSARRSSEFMAAVEMRGRSFWVGVDLGLGGQM